MYFSTNIEASIGTVMIEGKFNFESHKDFKAATGPLLETPGLTEIHLDLRNVNYMDSSSLGMVLLLREKADIKNISVLLLHPSNSVMTILNVVRFDKLFKIVE
jgi:anti-anti-sigma factor